MDYTQFSNFLRQMYATIYNDISRYSVHMYNERVNNQFFLILLCV